MLKTFKVTIFLISEDTDHPVPHSTTSRVREKPKNIGHIFLDVEVKFVKFCCMDGSLAELDTFLSGAGLEGLGGYSLESISPILEASAIAAIWSSGVG
jgi:hypothetical protein